MGLGQSLLLSINPKASKLAAYDLFAFSFLFFFVLIPCQVIKT